MEVGKRKRRLKAANDRKESLIKVLVTEEMKQQFTDAAEARGMNVSTWMRSIAIREAKDGREGGAK